MLEFLAHTGRVLRTWRINELLNGVVKMLVAAGADVNATGEGVSPLELASGREVDCLAAVQLLTDAGADVERKRWTLVKKASAFFHGRDPSIRRVGDYGDGAFFTLTTVEAVLAEGPGALIGWLLVRFPDLSVERHNLGLLLQMAAFLDKAELVQLLLERGVDVNSTTGYYGTALQAAARCGHISTLRLLLQAGANVNVIQGQHHTPLRAAILGAHGNVVRLLLDHGADPKLVQHGPRNWENHSQFTALQLAAKGGCDAHIVKLLLSHGLDASEETEWNGTHHPLISYCAAGNIDAVRVLVGSGAPPNIVGKARFGPGSDSGDSSDSEESGSNGGPSMADCFYDDEEVDGSETPNHGMYASPLHAASHNGHLDVMKFLIGAGANVNMAVEEVGTSLLVAAVQEQFQAVRLLIAAGASVDIGNGTVTPLAAAGIAGRVVVVKELLKAGAKVFESVPENTVWTPAVACVCSWYTYGGDSSDNDSDTSETTENSENLKVDKGTPKDRWRRVEECHGCTGSGPTRSAPGRLENALKVACVAKKFAVMEILLEHLYQVGQAEQAMEEAMELVIKEGSEDVFLQLLEYLPLDARSLRWAAACGSVSSLKILLDARKDILGELSGACESSLQLASFHLRVEVVRMLLTCGADPNWKSGSMGSPLVACMETCATSWLGSQIHRGGRVLAEKLLSIPAPTKFNERLHAAPEATTTPGLPVCEQIAGILVSAGASVHAISPVWGPALHLAALLGSETLLTLFLENGVDVNTKGGYFETALFASIEARRFSIVQMLLERGVDVQHNHLELGTPLHHACRMQSTECIKLLLDHGADHAAEDPRGNSVLTVLLKQQGRIRHATYRERDKNEPLTLLLNLQPRLPVREADILIASHSYNLCKTIPTLLAMNKDLVVPEEAIISFIHTAEFSTREDHLPLMIHRNGGLGVTEAILQAAAAAEAELKALLQLRPICKITPQLLTQCKSAYEIRDLIEHDPSLAITQDLATALIKRTAVSFLPRDALLHLLWSRNPNLVVTREMILHAAKDCSYLEFLLPRAPKGMKIPYRALVTASKSSQHSVKMVSLLLEHDKTLKAGAEAILASMGDHRSENENKTLDVLLSRAEEGVEITEEIFMRGFGEVDERETDRHKVRRGWAEVLKRHGVKVVPFTEKMRAVVRAAYGRESERGVRELFWSLEGKQGEGGEGVGDGE